MRTKLVLVIIVLLSIHCSSKIVTTDDALLYNNSLAIIWQQAQDIDRKMDIEFYDNHFSFSTVDSREFLDFLSKNQNEFSSLLKYIEEVPNLGRFNGMKPSLVNNILFYKKNLPLLYKDILLEKDNNETLETILKDYNQRFDKVQQVFLEEQNKLIKEFNLQYKTK